MPVSGEGFDEKDLKLVHYNMFQKPWKYEGILYEKYFWETAKKTPYYQMFKDVLNGYNDEKKRKDQEAGMKLLTYAEEIANNPNNFRRTLDVEREEMSSKQNVVLKTSEEFNVLDDFLNILFADDNPIGGECY